MTQRCSGHESARDLARRGRVLRPPRETAAWQALDFAPAEEFGFVYATEEREVGGVRQFVARAYGDIDCDTVRSTFARFVRVVGTEGACDAEVVPGLFTENESE